MNHIAIIPDGNRRWAKLHGKKPWEGHYEGYKRVKEIIKVVFDEFKIPYLTFYAFSSENLKKRSEEEKKHIFNLFKKGIEEIEKENKKYKARIRFLGRIHLLPEDLYKKMIEIMEKTKNNSEFNLTFLVVYDGQDEIVDAVKEIIKKGLRPEEINRETIKQFLYTKDLPPPDLIIRTGMRNEKRLSGFLLWDSSYSEFYFTSLFWPEFNKNAIRSAIYDFLNRERRFGK